MFEDSLIESGGRLKTKRGIWTFFSFVLEAVLVGVLVLIPLLFTEALPKTQLMTFLVAPPPPPPPPPPPAAPIKIVKQVQTNIINNQLRTPTKIPEKVQMIKEDEAPPPVMSAGVVGGVPGHSRGTDGWCHRRHYQFHAGCRAQGCHATARAGIPRCDPGTADPQNTAELSTSGTASTHPRKCAAASRNQQGRIHREPAFDQRPSHARTGSHRSGEAVEVQAIHFERRTGGSGNPDYGELHPVRRVGLRQRSFLIGCRCKKRSLRRLFSPNPFLTLAREQGGPRNSSL